MLPCHSCHSSKEEGVLNLKGGAKSQRWEFFVGVDSSFILSELPFLTSFGVIRVLYHALHNITSH